MDSYTECMDGESLHFPTGTPEELEAMRQADAEIEAEFYLTNDDLAFAREMDRVANLRRKDHKQMRNAYMREYQRKKRAQRSGTQTLGTPKGRETFRLLCAGL